MSVGIVVGIGVTFALMKSEVSDEIEQDLIGDSKVANDELLKIAKEHVRPGISHKNNLAIGEEGLFVADGSGGYPPYQFQWDFGDGSPASSLQNATHSYASAGEYEVQLTATDSKGKQGVISVTQTVSAP
jgi:uncharacterized membrane protein